MLAPWKKSYDQPRQHTKKQRHYFANKGLYSQSCGFSSSHVWMWELDCKEGWAPKNWWFWTVVLEKTLESLLDCKEIQPFNPKENQSWIFIRRTNVEAETPILWPPNTKNWLLGKDPDTGQDWKQEENGTTEDEMVGWHHWLNGHEFEQTPGVGDGQGSLACCSPWGHKNSDTTEGLNWIEHLILLLCFHGSGLVAKACQTLATPWTVACQAPLSMGFSRQDYWSGLPFPSPGNLPNLGIKPRSPALLADSLPTELQGKPLCFHGAQ